MVPAATEDTSYYFNSKTAGLHNVQLERRPLYVIEIKELDSNYVYSKRVVYIDKETLCPLLGDYYDQKDRKYRSMSTGWTWYPKIGQIDGGGAFWLYTDYVDAHSEIDAGLGLPAVWPDGKMSLRGLLKSSR